MASWRDELMETIKSKNERESEEERRRKKRLEEALEVADEAMGKAVDGLKFVDEQLRAKKQPAALVEREDGYQLAMREMTLAVALSRSEAVLSVSLNDGRPRDFDFSQDRHLSAADVEEYVGRRALELARAAQKDHPW